MNKYGVIMAGGGGTRFWPLSRKKNPKQLLNLSGKDLMINETIERIHEFIQYDNIFIVTNVEQAEDMAKAVAGKIKKENILVEPSARNTAACIGFAAAMIEKKFGEGIMCVFPADHYIRDVKEFQRIMEMGIQEAEQTAGLLTIGIQPDFPSTGYGYIKHENEEKAISQKVDKFVEKPDKTTAERYLNDGCFLWNSGMFIWKTNVILSEIKKYLPEVYNCLENIIEAINTPVERTVIEREYPRIPKISIDYGVMERSEIVRVIRGNFGWNDVGSWDMLEVLHKKDEAGNVVVGNHVCVDTVNSVVYAANKKIVATIGLEDIVVVDTQDALLVCTKDRVQDVKAIVERLENAGKREFL